MKNGSVADDRAGLKVSLVSTWQGLKFLVILLLLGLSAMNAQADSTNITLHINSARARQDTSVSNSVSFGCEMTFDNQTGAPLKVTGLYGPFDYFNLVVCDTNGIQLAQQAHGAIYSTIVSKSFILPEGQTTNALSFHWMTIPDSIKTVNIRIECGSQGGDGGIGSNHAVSNMMQVEIQDRAPTPPPRPKKRSWIQNLFQW